MQSQREVPADVIIFGSSRAGSYFDHRLLTRWATEFSGEAINVQNLNVAGGDVSLSYIFFKEYLEENSPEMVYVEVFRVKPQVSLMPYLNRAFSSTADWDMTTDLLIDFDDGRNGAFRLADTLRVMVDKTDKYISKALVKEYSISVEESVNCIRNAPFEPENYIDASTAKKRFNGLYKREIAAVRKNIKSAASIRKKENIARRERAIKRYKDNLGADWESHDPADWDYNSNMAKRQLYYYEKMSRLAAEKNVKLIYFRPYGLYEPEFTPELISRHEDILGSEIIIPPYNVSKLSYPYYVDPNHAGKQSKRLFALWLTEDFLTRSGKF